MKWKGENGAKKKFGEKPTLGGQEYYDWREFLTRKVPRNIALASPYCRRAKRNLSGNNTPG